MTELIVIITTNATVSPKKSASSRGPSLKQRQKAAVVVKFLIDNSAKLPMEK